MYENYFYNLINRPTSNAKTTATLIDNIFTNMKSEITSLSGILLTNVTDHFAIFHAIEVDKKARDEEFILTRKFREKNKL